jgi:hypothetical protein
VQPEERTWEPLVLWRGEVETVSGDLLNTVVCRGPLESYCICVCTRSG